MTTPMPLVESFTLRAPSASTGYLQRTDNQSTSVPLRPGMNTIQISWWGTSTLNVNHIGAGGVRTLGVEVKAPTQDREPRLTTFTLAVPKGPNADIRIRANAPTPEDVSHVTCGVMVINQPPA